MSLTTVILLPYSSSIILGYLIYRKTFTLITETNSLEEYGSLGNFCSQFVISWSGKLTQVLGEIDPSIRNYMACVNALNGLCEPVSIESQIARSIATNELECFRIYEAVNGHSYTDHCFIKKEGLLIYGLQFY